MIAVDADVANVASVASVENVADEAIVGGSNALTVMIEPTILASGMYRDILPLSYS